MWQAGATLHHGAQASHYLGLSLPSTGSRRAGSVIVAHGPSCSVACGIFPDQGSNPRPLHWQADSQPLRHQGSPRNKLLMCLATKIFFWWGFIAIIQPSLCQLIHRARSLGSLFCSSDLIVYPLLIHDILITTAL